MTNGIIDMLTGMDETLNNIRPADMAETNTLLASILRELTPGIEPNELGTLQLAYPNDGTRATLAAGTTDLDFDAGTVIATDGSVTMMSSSLRKHDKRHMQSVVVETDTDIVLQFDSHDKFPLAANKVFEADDYEFKRLRITSPGQAGVLVLSSSAV